MGIKEGSVLGDKRDQGQISPWGFVMKLTEARDNKESIVMTKIAENIQITKC